MSKIKFDLLNLIFPLGFDEFNLMIGSSKLCFKKIPGYDEVLESLKKRYDSQITSTVEIEYENDLNHSDAIELMSKVNHLLTFCRGTIINYDSYEINEEKTSVDPISSDFATRGLIDENDLNSTIRFIQEGYSSFNKIDEIYTLRKLAREYAYTRKNHSFITVRAYVAVILIEYLTSKYLETIGYNEYVVDEQIWTTNAPKLKNEFKDLLKKIFSTEEANSKQRKNLSSKLDFLNEKDLNRKIKRFAEDHNLLAGNDEIDKLVRIRNELVHESRFPKDEKIPDFWFVLNFLDKMLLSLFRYEGYYFNYFSQTFELINFDSR